MADEVLRIPRHPAQLSLPIGRLWNGSPCADPRLVAEARLSRLADGGLRVATIRTALLEAEQRIPKAPPGTRVADLWEYDVVEVFLVFPSGHYLELELGRAGHWLVLSFSGVRKRKDEHLDLRPDLRHRVEGARVTVEIDLPARLIEAEPTRVNAFAIAGGEFLAHAALPGPKPDFHQPSRFPRAALV